MLLNSFNVHLQCTTSNLKSVLKKTVGLLAEDIISY